MYFEPKYFSMKPEFEKIDKNINSSFRVFEHKNLKEYKPYHFHPEFEIVLITKGEGKRFVGDHIGFFKKNDLVLVGGNLPHCWVQNDEINAVVIQFNWEIFMDRVGNMPELIKIIELLEKATNGISFNEISTTCYKKLKKISMLEGIDRLICFLQLLNEMSIVKNYEVLSSFTFNDLHTQKHRIDKVLKYIYENFNHELNVNVAADILKMNVSAFCHYFKKTTNRTFSNFVNQVRIGYAGKLLIETDKNVSEIAFDSGYNSLSNFNKRFREKNGISPKEYRTKYLV
ncbi:helix-turn-helix domain-containing protein [Labilibacter sediminis]|nr:helix-turn-helix domain-containing protein [Labilibacter sediminis]